MSKPKNTTPAKKQARSADKATDKQDKGDTQPPVEKPASALAALLQAKGKSLADVKSKGRSGKGSILDPHREFIEECLSIDMSYVDITDFLREKVDKPDLRVETVRNHVQVKFVGKFRENAPTDMALEPWETVKPRLAAAVTAAMAPPEEQGES